MREQFAQTVTTSLLFQRMNPAEQQKLLTDIQTANEEQFLKIQQEFIRANQEIAAMEDKDKQQKDAAVKYAQDIQNSTKEIEKMTVREAEKADEEKSMEEAENLLKDEPRPKKRGFFAKIFGFLFGKK